MKVALPHNINVILKGIASDLRSRKSAEEKPLLKKEKGESAPAPAKNGVYVSTGRLGEKYANRTMAENIELLRAILRDMEANAKKPDEACEILKCLKLETKEDFKSETAGIMDIQI